MRPLKSFRIDSDLKAALRKTARERGETESEVIRRALREHLRIQSQSSEDEK